MGVLQEFKSFIKRGNVIDLAVAVVLGAAFGKIVSAIVDGILMPVIGAVTPSGDWRAWKVTSLHIDVGAVLGAMFDFLIVAAVIFLVVQKVMRGFKKDEPAAKTTKTCKECLEEIPLAAKRCRACAQPAA